MKSMLTVMGLISICAGLLWYLKPTEQQYTGQIDLVMPTTQTHPDVHVQPKQTYGFTESVDAGQAMATQAQLIAQRDRIYSEFGVIAMAMMEGQKPDLNQLSEMLKQHQALVEQGVISVEDAQNYLEYLSKVFPEMLPELNSYLLKLDAMKR